MIDWNAPLEFDDGTPVGPARSDPAWPHLMHVDVPRRPSRGVKDGYGPGHWYYNKDTGVFDGGSPERYFVIRNAPPRHDPTAEWFT